MQRGTGKVAEPITIGAEGNYFGHVIRQELFPGAVMAETRYSAGAILPEHRHEHPGFFLALQGRFITISRSSRSVSLAGDSEFHGANELHSVRVLAEQGRGFNIELMGQAEDCNSVASHHWNRGKHQVGVLLSSLYREFSFKDLASDLAIEGLTLQLKAELTRLRHKTSRVPPTWLRRAEEFLSDNAQRPLRLQDLAEAAGVEERELLGAFRRFKGCTPATYQSVPYGRSSSTGRRNQNEYC
jgi:quercetin dioxygenase-like cupin family protein